MSTWFVLKIVFSDNEQVPMPGLPAKHARTSWENQGQGVQPDPPDPQQVPPRSEDDKTLNDIELNGKDNGHWIGQHESFGFVPEDDQQTSIEQTHSFSSAATVPAASIPSRDFGFGAQFTQGFTHHVSTNAKEGSRFGFRRSTTVTENQLSGFSQAVGPQMIPNQVETGNRGGNCLECGQKGHFRRECPTRLCRCCGQSGHLAQCCPKKAKASNDGSCYYCREMGHIARECPKKVQADGQGACRFCRQQGHLASQCPRKAAGACFICNKTDHFAIVCPGRTTAPSSSSYIPPEVENKELLFDTEPIPKGINFNQQFDMPVDRYSGNQRLIDDNPPAK